MSTLDMMNFRRKSNNCTETNSAFSSEHSSDHKDMYVGGKKKRRYRYVGIQTDRQIGRRTSD